MKRVLRSAVHDDDDLAVCPFSKKRKLGNVEVVCNQLTSTEKQFLKSKVKDMRKATRARNLMKRNGTLRNLEECMLTTNDMLEMYCAQRGLCHTSGIPLQCRTYSKWQASPERLDDTRGYTKDNTVLVALEFNTAKQWNCAKFTAMFVDEVPTLDVLADFSVARKKHMKHEYPTDSNGDIRCWKCLQFKGITMFYGVNLAIGCKLCAGHYNEVLRCSARGKLQSLLRGSRTRHKKRSRTNAYEREHNLTLQVLIDQYRRQKGLCYYSDMPLQFDRPDMPWLISLERIDVTRTYTSDNIILICAELNATDHGAQCGNVELGWSRAKVAEVRAMHRV